MMRSFLKLSDNHLHCRTSETPLFSRVEDAPFAPNTVSEAMV